jgi:ABC-type multidrug transport system ATPase subunit
MVDTLEAPALDRLNAPVQFPRLSMKDVSLKSSQRNRSLNSVHLDLYSGEVLGIAGVVGSGQDEVASILTGLLEPNAGTLTLDGRPARWKALKQTKNIAAYVPSDAKKSSVASLTATENSLLRDIHRKEFVRGPFLRTGLIKETAVARIAALDVRPNDPSVLCGNLSGGNLQRLILARELDSPSAILVAVNPTAGLDLAMSLRVRKELRKAATGGKAVVVVSPDLQELLVTCDRISVMCSGAVVGTELAENLDAEALGLLLGGVRLDVVRKLFKVSQSADSSSMDLETRTTLFELLRSNSTWQKRLAAQMALRVFGHEDLSEVENRLLIEKNEECRAWLNIIRAKLGGPQYLNTLESAFREHPSVFAEVQRRILKCDDLKSLKITLRNRPDWGLSVWEELLSRLVIGHLEHDLAAPTSGQTLMGSQLQAFAQR